jgi:hypothetical protein
MADSFAHMNINRVRHHAAPHSIKSGKKDAVPVRQITAKGCKSISLNPRRVREAYHFQVFAQVIWVTRRQFDVRVNYPELSILQTMIVSGRDWSGFKALPGFQSKA